MRTIEAVGTITVAIAAEAGADGAFAVAGSRDPPLSVPSGHRYHGVAQTYAWNTGAEGIVDLHQVLELSRICPKPIAGMLVSLFNARENRFTQVLEFIDEAVRYLALASLAR